MGYRVIEHTGIFFSQRFGFLVVTQPFRPHRLQRCIVSRGKRARLKNLERNKLEKKIDRDSKIPRPRVTTQLFYNYKIITLSVKSRHCVDTKRRKSNRRHEIVGSSFFFIFFAGKDFSIKKTVLAFRKLILFLLRSQSQRRSSDLIF